jgi:hypothetical protein
VNPTTGASIMRLFGWLTAGTGLILLPIAGWLATSRPADMTASDATVAVLVTGLLGGGSLIVGVWLAVLGQRGVARHRRVLRDGLAVEAVVSDLRASATEINDQPMTIIEMVAYMPDGTMPRLKVKVLVPMNMANVLRPGLRLPVRVDPDRRDYAIIDWATAQRWTFAAQPWAAPSGAR